MLKEPYHFIFYALLCIILSCCKTSEKKLLNGKMTTFKNTILIINEHKANCEGNPNALCLQIKKEKQKHFEVFYQNIVGFEFEESYRQTILVEERKIEHPEIKQVIPIYTLIKVISKEKIIPNR